MATAAQKLPVNSIAVHRPADMPGIELCRGLRVTQPYPRHWHDELHFSLVTGGSGYVEAGGARRLTPAASLTVVAPGEVHANCTDHRDGCDFRSMYMDAAIVRRALKTGNGDAAALPDFREYVLSDPLVVRAFLDLHRALEDCETRLTRESLLVNFVRLLVMRHAETAPALEADAHEPAAIRRVREFMHAHYAEPLSLDDLAEVAGLTGFHLNRVFSRQFGLPPHAYQLHLRIMRAKAMLRARVPIAQVACDTGFVDQSHLSRHFRRIVGITPGRFAVSDGRKNVQDPAH